MGKYDNMDTDKIVAIRFQHLNKSWLDEINEMVGRLKRKFSGNGLLSIPWLGGKPQRPKWMIQVNPPEDDDKPNKN